MNRKRGTKTFAAAVVLAATVLTTGVVGASIAGADAKIAKPSQPAEKAWSFGVMADTQWTAADDGKNPNTVAVGIIRQLNSQFVAKHVKFVVQVGDLTDLQSTASLATTAVFRQDLYNAGIGFYPLRGNHENSQVSANEFARLFPQTQTAMMNATPSDAFNASNPDSATQPFPAQSGSPFKVGAISASPVAPSGFGGLCYAFDYGNARFVLLDQFNPTTGPSHSVLDATQVAWMNAQLAGRPANTHAFVFGHKGLINENHTDTLFGANPSVNAPLQNAFIGGLDANGVRYVMGGHDHMHSRAVVKSPDGLSSAQDITLASDSTKFYIPYGAAGYDARSVNPITKAVAPSGTLATADPLQTNDYIFNALVADGVPRETQLAQELNTIGYYVFTVQGSQVTVDYYSAVVNPTLDAGEYLISTTPSLHFVKRESFGYSLNGQEFQVAEGQALTGVVDTFDGTTARILGGENGSTATDSTGRAFTKTVDTGWEIPARGDQLVSNIVTLWGLADLGSSHTDNYALSVSYDAGGDHGRASGSESSDESAMLVTRDDHGRWVNAVSENSGGGKRFVRGHWKASYGLGTYGIDPSSHTAWAVVNHGGSFAVAHATED